ncbi:5-guanidino-2-oxopentanoate decarboxylase [Pseudomonas brassicacearum]|uniref:5-guanidino-2-oxopentanoate decarboxylase n=1 Tax=Pseudomonas brassicacearum TaxID=930166 RepID=UPI00025FDC84|nr:5-guanidino-2-oxopentanoate decarboxylase [Pseudomonas brassicacearum]EIK58151.1 putative thiamine pyrophosphate enzyme [Pseudomonas fluorescens Q8r1-96]KAB0526912.1 5-guanidino-2-oxopentanoate decarboxylase [Pseudomonas brassicacearum subsp. brassicacearum]NJP60855.1 5-guanidino-2-oxopentanoate decarboxylase [Pseudomonas brassicacearum]QEO81972.1 5-guanidino-2-oxopentanoate decarboxylase [Pseudomonas brassicacearum]SDP85006.1 acetolactate synthase-1/2/3 large subunit [Pseudomonas brassicac
MATCGEVLVKLLQAYGVEQVFGIPGVHTVELYRGLARSSIRHVTPRHEQGAGFMADGYARVSGKPGVCFIITGPGMTNITTAMGQAYADSIPMLVISSVQSRSQLGGGRGKLHELPNQAALVGGVAAFSHTLMSAAELPGVLARAFAVFQAGRPRPVHIEIPLDVLVEDADALLASVPVNINRAGAAPSAVAQMAATLASAKRPLILAGGGALDAAAELTELAERLGAPVALTINAKGLLPARHPLLIGSTQSLVATRALVAEADVVLAIGTELAETDYDITFAGGFEIPGALLRIDIDPDQTVRNYPPHLALVADARVAARAVLDALSQHPLAERRDDWGATRAARLRADLQGSWDAATRAQTLFLDTVLQALPEAVFVGDSTQPVYTGNLTFNPEQPRRWFNSSTGYGTLGYALPAAIGAWLGGKDRGHGRPPVVCLIGDGGLQFTLPELASAVEARTPVIVLLWNNQGYEEIKKYMVNRAIEPVGVDIYTPDFIGVAKALGCAAEAIDGVAQLHAALLTACDRQGPTLIEIDQATWMAQVSK